MTTEEFTKLCNETESGTPLTFDTGNGQVVQGKFVGCMEDAVIIEVNDQHVIWPYDLISYRQKGYPIPSYS